MRLLRFWNHWHTKITHSKKNANTKSWNKNARGKTAYGELIVFLVGQHTLIVSPNYSNRCFSNIFLDIYFDFKPKIELFCSMSDKNMLTFFLKFCLFLFLGTIPRFLFFSDLICTFLPFVTLLNETKAC